MTILKKIFVFLLIVAAADFLIGSALEYFYFQQKSGYQFRTTYSMEEAVSDVLIIGSSRANHHYHPDVFKSKMNYTYYNAGRDGNYIFYHYAILKSTLKRTHPKIVILDFTPADLILNTDSYDRISSLLPYYRSHPEIREIVELKSKYEKLKLFSRIYPYNSSILSIAIGNMELNKQRKVDHSGYVALDGVMGEKIKVIEKEYIYPVDTIKVRMLKEIIDLCKASDIKLYIVASPYYQLNKFEDESIRIAKEMSKKNGIVFLDYMACEGIFDNSNYFRDISHLNDTGAKIFSEKLIDTLNSLTLQGNGFEKK